MGPGTATGASVSHTQPGLGKHFLHCYADRIADCIACCIADCMYNHHACWPMIPPDVASVCYTQVSVCYHASQLQCWNSLQVLDVLAQALSL